MAAAMSMRRWWLALSVLPALWPSPAAAAGFEALEQPAVQSRTADRSALLAVTRAGARLVAVGERGIVLLSDDQGAHWRQATTPVRAGLTAVQFVDAQTGWAVGHLGVVLRTQDGGQTWTKQLDGLQAAQLMARAAEAEAGAGAAPAQAYAKLLADDGPDKPLLALHFRDARRGLVVGAYNLAFETQDGGRSWQPLSLQLPNPRSLHLYGVRRSGDTLLIVGEQGLVLRSDDGGRRYAALPSPYKGSWFGVVEAGEGAWLLYGLRGTAYRSTEGGSRWEPVTTGVAASISSAKRLRDGRLLLASQAGDLLQSRDGGRSFSAHGVALQAAVADVTEAANGTLALATLRGPLVSGRRAPQ